MYIQRRDLRQSELDNHETEYTRFRTLFRFTYYENYSHCKTSYSGPLRLLPSIKVRVCVFSNVKTKTTTDTYSARKVCWRGNRFCLRTNIKLQILRYTIRTVGGFVQIHPQVGKHPFQHLLSGMFKFRVNSKPKL